MLKRLLLGAIILSLMLSSLPATNAQDNPLTVVASTSMIADVARNVAGEAAVVQSLMPLGADPHTFQPTPREVATLADADLVFINGMNFEAQLIPIIENADEDINMVVVSSCVEVIALGGHRHDEHDHDNDHDENREDRENRDDNHEHNSVEVAGSGMAARCAAHAAEVAALHDGNTHEHGGTLGRLYAIDCGQQSHDRDAQGCDPHVWMNPRNVMLWTLFIRDTLAAHDPDHAGTYIANAAAYLDALEIVVERVEERLAEIPPERRVLVTSHEALGYFAAAFDFEIVGVVIPGGSTVAEPSAQDLIRLIETVEAEGVPAIFTETTVTTGLAATVAAETGVPVLTLYTGSLSEAGGPATTYLDFITYNVNTIVDAYSE